MTERNYTYYNLGVAIAGFRVEDGTISFRTRDLETMAWSGYAPLDPQNGLYQYPDHI